MNFTVSERVGSVYHDVFVSYENIEKLIMQKFSKETFMVE